MAVAEHVDEGGPFGQRPGEGRGVGGAGAPIDGTREVRLQGRDLIGQGAESPRAGVGPVRGGGRVRQGAEFRAGERAWPGGREPRAGRRRVVPRRPPRRVPCGPARRHTTRGRRPAPRRERQGRVQADARGAEQGDLLALGERGQGRSQQLIGDGQGAARELARRVGVAGVAEEQGEIRQGGDGPASLALDPLGEPQRLLEHRPGAGEVSLVVEERRQVVQAGDRLGVALAQDLAAEPQRLLEHRPGRRQVPLLLPEDGEVIEAHDGRGVAAAEHLRPEPERPLAHLARRRGSPGRAAASRGCSGADGVRDGARRGPRH